MADRYHSKVDWAEWRRRLDAIACVCVVAEPRDQIEILRSFHDLMAFAPDEPWLDGVAMPTVTMLEKTLAIGACETAALAFVAPRTGCMISRGSDGYHLASIALHGCASEVSARGTTLALAVLAALAGAIGNLISGRQPATLDVPGASRLLH